MSNTTVLDNAVYLIYNDEILIHNVSKVQDFTILDF